MRMRGIPITLGLFALTLLANVLPARVATSAATDWTQGFYALACDAAPGSIPLADGPFPPEGCSPVSDGALQLTTLEGYLVDSCWLISNDRCNLSGELSVPYLVELVAGDIPEGYVAHNNPSFYRGETGIETGVVFIPSDAIDDNADGAEVTIHSRYCPTGYQGADLFNDCHGTAPPFHQVFGADDKTVRTDDEGNATFDHLSPGKWSIWTYLRNTDLLRDAFCSYADTPGVRSDNYSIKSGQASGTLHLGMELHAGDSLVCDVYVTPYDVPRDDVLLTVRVRFCNELSSPAQIYEDCFDGGGSFMFVVAGSNNFSLQGHLDDDGNATLLAPPGRYYAGPAYGHDVIGTYTSCSRNGDPETVIEDVPEMESGEAWTCDYFFKFGSNR